MFLSQLRLRRWGVARNLNVTRQSRRQNTARWRVPLGLGVVPRWTVNYWPNRAQGEPCLQVRYEIGSASLSSHT